MSSLPEHDPHQEAENTASDSRLTSSSADYRLEAPRKMKSLTGEVTPSGLDEGTEKLVGSIHHLSALQENLRRIAEMKRQLLNIEAQHTAEPKKEPPKKSQPNNLIPFPGAAKRHEATDPLKSSSAVAQGSEKQVTTDKAKSAPSAREQKPSDAPLNSLAPTLAELANATKGLEALLTEIGKIKETKVAAESSVGGTAAETTADEGTAVPSSHKEIPHGRQTPEVILPPEHSIEQRSVAKPLERAAVDQEIRELVKCYGHVDIYAPPSGKLLLRKAVISGSAVLFLLAASYFFFFTAHSRPVVTSSAHVAETTPVEERPLSSP